MYKIGYYEIFINKEIGSGAYSKVYIGQCNNDDLIKKNGCNVVAIKKIIVKDLSYKHHKMVSEEIKIMKRIKENPHPNIVKCYDIIDDLDTIYIVMEYCQDGDFSKLVGKSMSEESARYYFKQIINGIKYLDNNQIMHRDIKPKNILLTGRTLKICDFGLAKNKTELSRVQTICGSPLYMAPELFNDKQYDYKVDVWAVGVILYEMLFAVNPFSKIKDYGQLEHVMRENDEISIPNTPSISAQGLDLLKILLKKDKESRISLEDLYNHPWLLGEIDDDQFENDNEASLDDSMVFSLDF